MDASILLDTVNELDPREVIAAVESVPYAAREDIVLPDGTTVMVATLADLVEDQVCGVFFHHDGVNPYAFIAHGHESVEDAARCMAIMVARIHAVSSRSPMAEDIRRLMGDGPFYV